MQQYNSPFIFLIQTGACVFLLGIAFFYFDPLNALQQETDTTNVIMYSMILPVVFIGITFAVSLLAGLPLRLIPAIHHWWVSRPMLQAALLITGVIILFLSLHPALKIQEEYESNEEWVVRSTVNEYISLTGWFLSAFCLLNSYPIVIFDRLSKRISRITFISYF